MKTTEKIWEEYQAKLYAFILGRVTDSATADDILQDVFVKIHSRLDSIKADTKLESWLYQITRHTIIDYYRVRKITEDMPASVAQLEIEPSEQARQEIEACLMPMISQLPETYREAIAMSELEGKTQKQVAHEQGISLSGAKSRIQRARVLLKGMLHECCQFEFDQRGQLVDYETKKKNGDGKNFCC